jgi:hypothetical protein
MNKELLLKTEKDFLELYPDGFQSEELVQFSKKHNFKKTENFANKVFAKDEFIYQEQILANMIKLVNKSSMVSLFEKPKFRDMIAVLDEIEKQEMVSGLKQLLFEDEKRGFNTLLEILNQHQMAKWTIISVFRCYYYPDTDLLFKPTTVKGIINKFELEDIKYKPTPSYDFFVKYRGYINEMNSYTSYSISPNLSAFSGFLYMTM